VDLDAQPAQQRVAARFSRGKRAFSSSRTRPSSSGRACSSASAVVEPAGPAPTMTTSKSSAGTQAEH
jgi:hypothetical protein